MTTDDLMTRRDVAALLGVHPDSASRMLPEGLGACVRSWGGHGKAMTFSKALVLRWYAARTCPARAAGRGCWPCRGTLEDCQVTATHLIRARHDAVTLFARCPFDGEEPCGHPGGFSEPCRPPAELLALNRECRSS